MRCASLVGLLSLAVACTPPEPDTPSATQVEVTPPPAVGTAPELVPPNAPAPSSEKPLEPAPPGPAEPESRPAQQPSAAEAKACAARGGKMEPVCLTGHLTCVVRYRDAGKRCTDKADCQGECLYEGEVPPPPKPTGHCQATSDPCGCKAPMIKGQVQPTLCTD